MAKTTNVLEEALRLWETLCYISGRLNLVMGKGMDNHEKNFHEFRKFLLTRSPDFPWEKFEASELTMEADSAAGGWLQLPQEIHQWSMCSRRIYRLTEELQQFLETTSIRNITWNDVTFPFDSFGISLPLPLKVPVAYTNTTQPVSPISFILFTRCESIAGALIFEAKMLGVNPTYIPPSKDKQLQIDKLIAKGRMEEAHRILHQKAKAFENSGSYSNVVRFIIPQDKLDGSIVQHLKDMTRLNDQISLEAMQFNQEAKELLGHEEDAEEMDDISRSLTRILIGLCVYLQSRPTMETSPTPPREEWEKVTTVDPKSLVSESQVCTITAEGLLSPESARFHRIMKEKGMAQAMIEMGTHFRTAHWRRPPGKGGDINAIKTVFVRSTIVRPDRLPEEGLPPGNEMKVA